MAAEQILFDCVLTAALVLSLVPAPALAAFPAPSISEALVGGCGEGPTADLELDKSVDEPHPNVGDEITFTIALTNQGPDPATNVEVSEIWPAGLCYVSDDGGGTYDPLTGIWDVGTLPSGETATLNVIVAVESHGHFANSAQVSASDQCDPDSTPGNDKVGEDDKDMVSIDTQEADLSLTKSVDNYMPGVGDEVVFTIGLSNGGPDAATNVQVWDRLPAGLGYRSDDSDGAYNSATGIWDVGDLVSGGVATLNITAVVQGLGTFVNVARIDAVDQFDPDSTPGNDEITEDDQDVATAHVGSVADLSITKTYSPDLVRVGQPLNYTIRVTNGGPADATDVTLTDVLLADVDFGSVLPSQGSCSGMGTVICSLGNLAHGGVATVTLVVTPTTPGTLTNVASVTGGEFDPDTSNNAAVASVRVLYPEITVAKTPDAQTLESGWPVFFTIAVTNTGDVALADVTVTDALAPACDANLGGLEAGASISYNCMVIGATSDFTNSVTATGTPPVGPVVSDTDTATVHFRPPYTPLASLTFLPLIPINGDAYAHAADLVVEHIIATIDNVQVVIKNQGDAPVTPAEAFWVDLYINPNPVPQGVNETWGSLCSEGIVWGVTEPALPLEPGETLVLTVGGAYYWPEYSDFSGALPVGTPIYVQVDSANVNTTYGAVLETHEILGAPYNNIGGPVYVTGGVGEELGEGKLPGGGALPPRP